MKRVVFEKSCLFAEEVGLADHKIHNVGKVIVSEKKDRLNVYFNDRDLKPGVIEVLDLLSVSGFSFGFGYSRDEDEARGCDDRPILRKKYLAQDRRIIFERLCKSRLRGGLYRGGVPERRIDPNGAEE